MNRVGTSSEAAAGSDNGCRLIAEISDRIGDLGVETADISGNLYEVSSRVARQAEQFKGLRKTAETMIALNRDIDGAARLAQAASAAAAAEATQSRGVVDGA